MKFVRIPKRGIVRVARHDACRTGGDWIAVQHQLRTRIDHGLLIPPISAFESQLDLQTHFLFDTAGLPRMAGAASCRHRYPVGWVSQERLRQAKHDLA